MADELQGFRLPEGTTGVHVKERDGEVSGVVFLEAFKKGRHPRVDLRAQSSCSGVRVQVTLENSRLRAQYPLGY